MFRVLGYGLAFPSDKRTTYGSIISALGIQFPSRNRVYVDDAAVSSPRVRNEGPMMLMMLVNLLKLTVPRCPSKRRTQTF